MEKDEAIDQIIEAIAEDFSFAELLDVSYMRQELDKLIQIEDWKLVPLLFVRHSAEDPPAGKTAVLASTLPDALTRSATTLSGDRERTKKTRLRRTGICVLNSGPNRSKAAELPPLEGMLVVFDTTSSAAGRTPRQSMAF